jgi:hypothetical protein
VRAIRHMEERRYGSTHSEPRAGWAWVVTFTPQPIYHRGNVLGARCTGGWLSHGRSGHFVEETEISCPYRESNHDFSVSHPAARPCYAGEPANQWKNARCLNLRLVRDVVFSFRRVYRVRLKTVLCDVWERACYLLFSCLVL